MSRHGCNDYDDYDPLACGRWQGAVRKAIYGKRGQRLLRDLIEALDAMPESERRLAHGLFVEGGSCCALGAVAVRRGVDLTDLDPDDDCHYIAGRLSKRLDIASVLASEVMYENDEAPVRVKRVGQLLRSECWRSMQTEDDGAPLWINGWDAERRAHLSRSDSQHGPIQYVPAVLSTEADVEQAERERWAHVRRWAEARLLEESTT